MKFAVLGTGIVGRTIGGKLVALGHEVTMGSRRADHPEAQEWAGSAGERAKVATFADAAHFGEVVVNATMGMATLDALAAAGRENLEGKILLDVSNPLDFSQGFPPSLSVVNTESLAEQVQAAYPQARVVKALNTISAPVMVEPSLVPGHHSVFLSGNDPEARAEVGRLLQSFGWPADDILELGDITNARGTEMYLALWVRLFGVTGTPYFNVNVVHGPAAGA